RECGAPRRKYLGRYVLWNGERARPKRTWQGLDAGAREVKAGGVHLTDDQRYFLDQGLIERVEGAYVPCDHCNRAAVWWIPGKTSAWLCDEHWESIVDTKM